MYPMGPVRPFALVPGPLGPSCLHFGLFGPPPLVGAPVRCLVPFATAKQDLNNICSTKHGGLAVGRPPYPVWTCDLDFGQLDRGGCPGRHPVGLGLLQKLGCPEWDPWGLFVHLEIDKFLQWQFLTWGQLGLVKNPFGLGIFWRQHLFPPLGSKIWKNALNAFPKMAMVVFGIFDLLGPWKWT